MQSLFVRSLNDLKKNWIKASIDYIFMAVSKWNIEPSIINFYGKSRILTDNNL